MKVMQKQTTVKVSMKILFLLLVKLSISPKTVFEYPNSVSKKPNLSFMFCSFKPSL